MNYHLVEGFNYPDGVGRNSVIIQLYDCLLSIDEQRHLTEKNRKNGYYTSFTILLHTDPMIDKIKKRIAIADNIQKIDS